MNKLIVFFFVILIFNISNAESDLKIWQEEELTEPFMRSISKDQCTNKTITTLTENCKSDSCVKTMGGILGDCLTWSKGSSITYCNNYDLNYTRQCIENRIDGRTCWFVNFIKDQYCKKPLADLEENTKKLTPLEIFTSYNLLGEWSSDCSKKSIYTNNRAYGSKLLEEKFTNKLISQKALYSNVKIIEKDTFTYTQYVYNNKDELTSIVSGITQVINPNKQKQIYLEIKPINASSATIVIENGKSLISPNIASYVTRCDI